MDYHTLPRRQLQTLCKKHGMPANAANSDMADALTALLKPKPQVHADSNTKQPAKRATRGRESAMGEMESKSKDVEEVSNMKPQEPTNSRKILEEEPNRKPQRVTRGRGTACAVSGAPKSATMKTEKTPTTGETESNSDTKQQEAKKVGTRNGATKQTNMEMPMNTEESVDSKAVCPKSDKKKEKAGGIVLRRGRVKVRSSGNLSKSPESERIKAVTTEVEAWTNQSCLVDAKKTRKKKRSVTFSDVLEISSACVEHPSRDVEEPAKETMAEISLEQPSRDFEEPAKETMAEISLGADPNLPKTTTSACIAKRVVGTRRASRSVSTKDCVQDVIGAQGDHQKNSKEPLAKASKAEGLHAFDAEKTDDIEIGGQSDRKKSVRGKIIVNSVGEAAAKENEEEKEQPSRDFEEPAKETMAEISLGADPNLPKTTTSACIAKRVVGTRRASRSVSTKDCVQDVIGAQGDHQKNSKEPLAKASKAEGLHAFDAEKTADIEIGGQSDRKKSVRGKIIVNSVGEAAAKENEEEKVADGFIKGEHIENVPCTRRSRRLTIVPTDVKFNQDMQLGTEQLKGGQSKDHHEGSSISAEKTDGALPAETSRKSRRKTLAPLELNHVQSNVLSASEQKEKRVSKAKDTQSKPYASELKEEALESKQKRTSDSTPVATQAEVPPIKNKEALSVRSVRGSRQKALVASKEVSNEVGYQNICTTEIISGKVEANVHTIESEKADRQAPLCSSIVANSEPHSLQEFSNDAIVEVETVKTTSAMPRSTRKTSEVSTCPDNGSAVSQEKQTNIVKQEGLVFVDEAVGRNIQDSEDPDVVDQAYIEQSREILVLKKTNKPRVEDPPVDNTLPNEDINHSNSFSSAFKIVTGKGERQNQINSEDANSVSCNEEFANNTCSTATHHATCDSETAISSPLVDKLDAADVECHEFTEETASATSSECVGQGHEFTNEMHFEILKQEGHGMDELASITSLTEDINEKSRSDSPVAIMIQDNGSLDNDLENIIDIHTDEGITASSPGAIVESTFEHENCIDIGIHTDEGVTATSTGAIVESTFEHQNSIDIATDEQESCTPEVHFLTSDKDTIANLTSGGAADLMEEQPNQAVELNLCGEDVVDKEEGHGMDELASITSLTEDINEKSRSDSPVAIMIQVNGSLDNDLENITDIHTDEGITASSPGAIVESTFEHENCIDIGIHTDEGVTASSPGAIVESTFEHENCIDIGIHTDEGVTATSAGAIVESIFEHQNSIDIATSEQESCTPEVHLLTSDKDTTANLTSGGAADLVEEQPNQAVELNLGGEDAVDKEDMEIHGDLQKEQLQDTNEGVPSDGVKSIEDLSKTDDQLAQLPPLLPSCSAEPGVATPRECACKTKQRRRPRSIFKSARKPMFSAQWEDRSLEQNTAPPPIKEGSLDSLDVKKDAEIWGLDSHEMSGDEVDSASSEEEESSAETEETLSDTEVCNFNTEMLISNTEGDYSCSEDDTPSDIEEDSMSNSEDDFSEMEGELLSGEEECCESEEPDTSEEELSESEDDGEDDFEEFEGSPVSQLVAHSESFDALCATHGLEDQQAATTAPSNSESFDALCTMHGLQDQQVATIAPSKLSHADDGITQPEIVNHLPLVNITNGCLPDVDPTDIDEKIGGQHKELVGIQENVDVDMSYIDDTAVERVQSTTVSTCEDGDDSLTSLSSLFATPASKVKEDVKCSLAPPSIGILESNISQQSSGTLETEQNIFPESGQEEGVQLRSPCELLHQDVIAEVEQDTLDEAKHGSEVCESVGAVEEELEISRQMVELVEACVEYSLAGPAVVDCYTASPMLDNVQNSQLLQPDSKNVFISGNENEQTHPSVSESPCLGHCELILETNGAEIGKEEDASEGQEEPGNFKIIRDGIEEDEAGSVEVKNDLENNEVSVGMALDAQNDSEDPIEQVDCREGTTSELTEELMLTAAEQDRQMLHPDSDFSLDDLPQKQDNEDTLALDMTPNAIGTTDTVVSLESAKELDTSCHLLEEGELLLPLECEQDLMPSDACEQPKTKAIEEEPEVIHSESNVESLIDHCSTPKGSKDSEIERAFDHESLDEVAQTLHCVQNESVHAQVEEVHEKPLEESQSSEASNEDNEAAVEHNLISKEQSMKQIDLTLLSVRKLRQMCKGNPMSAKKKTENVTPARKPWMSATKQVQLPNTSMHPRDLPSGNKRSALQALSSNVKAAPSAAMQTPTAKTLQRPRNLMGTLDGNEGPGKHLVTPSPQAPMSSKRDFARSHHR